MSCPICYETYKDLLQVVASPCFHSFCHECIDDMIDHNGDFECAVCRQEIDMFTPVFKEGDYGYQKKLFAKIQRWNEFSRYVDEVRINTWNEYFEYLVENKVKWIDTELNFASSCKSLMLYDGMFRPGFDMSLITEDIKSHILRHLLDCKSLVKIFQSDGQHEKTIMERVWRIWQYIYKPEEMLYYLDEKRSIRPGLVWACHWVLPQCINQINDVTKNKQVAVDYVFDRQPCPDIEDPTTKNIFCAMFKETPLDRFLEVLVQRDKTLFGILVRTLVPQK